MAFTYVIDEITVFGNKKCILGSYASESGSTGGDIDTGLTNCTDMFLQGVGAAVDVAEPNINETFPVAGGVMTIVTTADKVGRFMALGY